MKQIIFIAALIFSTMVSANAQSIGWENMVTLDVAITGANSVTSDGYGQHLVGEYSGVVKHFLVGNDNTIIYNTLSVAGASYPSVSSYGGKGSALALFDVFRL